MAMTAMDLVAAAKQQIREVDQTTGCSLLETGLVLDVREPDEYAAGCLPGAVNIPRGVLEFRIDSHPSFLGRKDAQILIYCQSGGRSALAAEALQKLGFSHPCSLAGGFKAWSDAGLPVTRPSGGS
jgi:rhodanese-related sulfurtransferase